MIQIVSQERKIMDERTERIINEEVRRYELEQIDQERKLEEINSYFADEEKKRAQEAQEKALHNEYMSWLYKSADETWKDYCELAKKVEELQTELIKQKPIIRDELIAEKNRHKKLRRTQCIVAIIILMAVLVCLRINDNWSIVDTILEFFCDLLKGLFYIIKKIIEFFWSFFKNNG